MNDTTFDADAFMNTNVDAPMATDLAGVPDGEYVAMVGDFDSSAFKTITYNDKNGEQVSRAILEIPFPIQDDALKAKMGRESISHRESFWLDFDSNGKLDTGPDKNVSLGKLRSALGQNTNGPWNPSMLKNMGPLRIVIRSRPNPKDPEKKYTNIVKYAKIS